LYRSGKAAKQGDKKMTTMKQPWLRRSFEMSDRIRAETDAILESMALEIEHRTDLTLGQKLDILTDLTNALHSLNKAKAGI
jgi:hypothetical protein